ncbi:AraC family transcriptional regulator [Chryseobacterium daecheongense]|uniref:AraC family transcriptional regulator n=1 Tax=Chryseobacterium daecheongense TaxID=192389 RepID=A0A3N0VSS7_9FLAO|nr:AraC family transcriptional regulator [Chryseobacterium daecheongense]ROH95872.1 AraC family transcriptional regulator [Chryseobacterium daecheongense]TDX91733.1 AraC family transcriptional regulator [Chryseobacterium daecheongense]
MSKLENILREITPLSPEDSFLVFDRIKASFDFPYHYHPEIEINFVYKGKGYRRMIGDHTGEIGNLELVLVGPNLPHCWANHKCKNRKTHEITVQFNQDFFNQSVMEKNILKPIHNLIKESIRGILFSQETAEKLKDSFLNLSKMSSFESFIEIMKILNELAIAENKTLLSSYSIELETFVDNDKMKTVHDFVHKNFENKITLDDAAALVNMSSVTFNRFIKKRTGKTFVNYLNEIRISYAARWLMEKNLTVSETAFEAGFNNIANFNKVFKSIKKTTPTEFKELFKGVKKIE